MTGREMLLRLSNRIGSQPQTIDFVSALNSTVTALVNHLWSVNSDWLRDDFSAQYRSGVTGVSLPCDFLGFVDRPYLSYGNPVVKRTISPLPSERLKSLSDSGTPEYYDMRGSMVRLFPIPNADGYLKGRYYARPKDLETLDDDLPFSGFFDQIIQDAVVTVAQQGVFVCQTPAFVAMISKQVDGILSKRAPKRVHFRGMK